MYLGSETMKILLYTEGLNKIGKSGLGKAVKHQQKALEDNNIEYTLDPKCKDYDIVHINWYGPRSYFLAKKAHRMGKKIVYHAHSTEEDFRNSFKFSNQIAPLFKKWICKCYKMGDVIITPTEYSKKLLEGYNLNRPIKAISNGIDMSFFEKDEKLGKKFRKDFGYKDSDKVIMGVGLYLKRKGILDFVELAKRLPQYKFIWFGYLDLKLVPKEIKEAVETKLPNLCFAGYVEPKVLRGAYSGCDLYIFPTLEETEGIPILEAFTSRIKTIVRDIPVFDWIKENKEVYKGKNVDEFEDLIKNILDGDYKDLTDNAYVLVKRFSIKSVGEELVETYKELIKK